MNMTMNEFYALQCRDSCLRSWHTVRESSSGEILCFEMSESGYLKAIESAKTRANKYSMEYRVIKVEWVTMVDSIKKS